MLETALRDLNKIPGSERKTESSSAPCLIKPSLDNAKKSTGDHTVKCVSVASPPANGNQAVEAGNGIGSVDVEYIESENLNDLEDMDSCLKTLLTDLNSKDWLVVCESLNNVRRLSLYHKEAMLDMLKDAINMVAKSLKSPRSAVCKTAIMTSADIFEAYNDLIMDSLDPLLVQLLLKSSQDKRFVCEAAEKALVAMTTWISPMTLLPKLQPYLKNRNPRIRAKASMCFSRSVPRLGDEGIKAFGIDKLIQIAASQLSDQLPVSREAARGLILELQNICEKSHDIVPAVVSDSSEISGKTSWENFCLSQLSPLSAQAVLRVTNAREGLVLGSLTCIANT